MSDITSVLGGARQGIVERVSWDEYRGAVGLNPSTIVHGLKSMLHLKHAWDCGRPDSDAMQWGRAMHCLLFEPREFENRFRAWHGRRDKRNEEYRDFLEAAVQDGAEVMKADGPHSLATALEAAGSFLRNGRVQEIVRSGQPEVTVFAVEGDVQCRGRVDWISVSADCMVDLKTTRNLEPRAFGADFFRFHYDVKLGLYRRWLRQCGLVLPVSVVAIESTPPYDLAVIPVPDAVLDRGEEKGVEVIGRVERCCKTGNWPGVCGEEEGSLVVPGYVMDDELVPFEDDEDDAA